jgi:hypothetical protein
MTWHEPTYKTTDPRSDDDHLLLASRIRRFGQSGFQGFQQQVFPVFGVETRHARWRTRFPRRHVTYILVLERFFLKRQLVYFCIVLVAIFTKGSFSLGKKCSAKLPQSSDSDNLLWQPYVMRCKNDRLYQCYVIQGGHGKKN